MKILERLSIVCKEATMLPLADMFNEKGIFHDSSVTRVGMDTIHLEGKMAIEMMFPPQIQFNGGPC